MGRPKGSKNKPKQSKIQEAIQAVEKVEKSDKKEIQPTSQLEVLPAVREFILQNFGKMSGEELAMKCNLSVRQVEDIATDITQHFPDLKNEDKPSRIAGGFIKVSGAVIGTEASGRISDTFTKTVKLNPKVEGLEQIKVNKSN